MQQHCFLSCAAPHDHSHKLSCVVYKSDNRAVKSSIFVSTVHVGDPHAESVAGEKQSKITDDTTSVSRLREYRST